jgi:hypothetical protein
MNKFAKRILMISSAVTLAAILAAAIAPKAARALAAALVQVTNTTANPVPNLDVNTPGEEPLETMICVDDGAFSSFGVCAGTYPVSLKPIIPGPNNFIVPSTTSDGANVKRLVIENASGFCVTNGAQSGGGLSLSASINENVVNNESSVVLVIPVPQAVVASELAVFSQPTRFYVDPGQTLTLAPFFGSDVVCNLNLTGHLVTK